MATKDHSGKNEVAFQRAFGAGVGCDGRCGQRLATTLGPAAASPLPLLPGLRPTQCVCEPLPQLLEACSAHSPESETTTTRRFGSIRGLHRWTASCGAADPRAPGIVCGGPWTRPCCRA